MSTILAWAAFVFGAFLCLTNFYLSFVSYPFHRLHGLPKESYRWNSGIPVFASLFVGLSLLGLHSLPGLLPIVVGLILIDTGGLHWCLGMVIYQSLAGTKQKSGY